jgi:hypothetical protein
MAGSDSQRQGDVLGGEFAYALATAKFAKMLK